MASFLQKVEAGWSYVENPETQPCLSTLKITSLPRRWCKYGRSLKYFSQDGLNVKQLDLFETLLPSDLRKVSKAILETVAKWLKFTCWLFQCYSVWSCQYGKSKVPRSVPTFWLSFGALFCGGSPSWTKLWDNLDLAVFARFWPPKNFWKKTFLWHSCHLDLTIWTLGDVIEAVAKAFGLRAREDLQLVFSEISIFPQQWSFCLFSRQKSIQMTSFHKNKPAVMF